VLHVLDEQELERIFLFFLRLEVEVRWGFFAEVVAKFGVGAGVLGLIPCLLDDFIDKSLADNLALKEIRKDILFDVAQVLRDDQVEVVDNFLPGQLKFVKIFVSFLDFVEETTIFPTLLELVLHLLCLQGFFGADHNLHLAVAGSFITEPRCFRGLITMGTHASSDGVVIVSWSFSSVSISGLAFLPGKLGVLILEFDFNFFGFPLLYFLDLGDNFGVGRFFEFFLAVGVDEFLDLADAELGGLGNRFGRGRRWFDDGFGFEFGFGFGFGFFPDRFWLCCGFFVFGFLLLIGDSFFMVIFLAVVPFFFVLPVVFLVGVVPAVSLTLVSSLLLRVSSLLLLLRVLLLGVLFWLGVLLGLLLVVLVLLLLGIVVLALAVSLLSVGLLPIGLLLLSIGLVVALPIGLSVSLLLLSVWLLITLTVLLLLCISIGILAVSLIRLLRVVVLPISALATILGGQILDDFPKFGPKFFEFLSDFRMVFEVAIEAGVDEEDIFEELIVISMGMVEQIAHAHVSHLRNDITNACDQHHALLLVPLS
jgi:hypothetical protein